MGKVLTTKQAIKISEQVRNEGRIIVLAGGCFDILHIGHIVFLEKAKAAGGVLFVLLEHDAMIKKIKGHNRPINTQEDRAKILASLTVVDYVVLLPPVVDNDFYDTLTMQIKPAIIATTAGDAHITHKKRQATVIDAKVIAVTLAIQDQSTTKLIKLLEKISYEP